MTFLEAVQCCPVVDREFRQWTLQSFDVGFPVIYLIIFQPLRCIFDVADGLP